MNLTVPCRAGVVPHLLAGGLALLYAWSISRTSFVTSGLQFVTPVLIIGGVHLFWMAWRQGLDVGFSVQVYRRSFHTALLILTLLVLGSVFAPQPAYAANGRGGETILMVIVCAAMVAIVIGLVGFIFYVVAVLFGLVPWPGEKGDDEGPQSRLFDIGSLVLGLSVIGLASAEGTPRGYAFPTRYQSSVAYSVDASPDQIWRVMQIATSPDFPLPSIFGFLPRPTEVSIDEGVVLGANRIVRISGREGDGTLVLKVVERTETSVVFAVVSDTSPMASWIAFDRLTYQVLPVANGSKITVSLDYERKLAPAWFFGPLMRGASTFAVDVLARDVKIRSEL